ncbi:MAG: hypothetical protein E7225_02710 [Clostridiales bacterium]|nr:hypothetical protein [Clostridiales bacterium]
MYGTKRLYERDWIMKKHLLLSLLFCIVLVFGSMSFVFADGWDEYDVYYDGKDTRETGYYVKGNVYLPVSMIGDYFDNDCITKIDKKAMKLYMDLTNANILMADDATTQFIKNNAGIVYIPLKQLNGNVCFSMNVMQQFFHTGYSVSGDDIKLKPIDGSVEIARIGSEYADAAVSLFSTGEEDGKLTYTSGDMVFIEGETANYYKVSDFDDNTSYILKSDVIIEDIDLSSIDFYAPRQHKFKPAIGQKINLAWQYISNVSPEAPSPIDGIDIMAPTWFRLVVNGNGEIENVGDRGYTDLCHDNGFMVWATITNNFSSSYTTTLFNDETIEDKAIAQYIFYACLYDVDGINIDFESVKDADADGLTEFTMKMRKYTEPQGLVLSIDTMVPKPWNSEYDRDALSDYVDYLAVMSYDEHYAGSKIPGSISSIPFVIEAIEGCLDEGVPAEKLLMGVPLYTRVWTVNSNGSIISNPAVTMERMNEIIDENDLDLTYLSYEMQNYAEYKNSGGTAKVWIEDETSITNRLSLVYEYDIAGSACWQFNQGTDEIWEVFDRYLH